ncbi:MAG TPA: cell wall-active antibiotics response protein LiaF [Anaerolineales bacterium]|nr:cell wall-active antibiotics response protein LiaF [Anaerolineales bacterium]
MRDRRQFIFGGLVLFIGLVSLLSVILNIDFWDFCWPVGLILLGVWLLVRPRYSSLESNLVIRPLGDVHHYGERPLRDREIWIFVGDIDFDLTQAEISRGDTTIRIYGFVGEVNLRAPRAVGVSVSSTAFITDGHLWGEKRDHFLTPVRRVSEGYETAERRVRLEVMFFVVDLRVDQE